MCKRMLTHQQISCKRFSLCMIIVRIVYICLCNAITERDVRECVRSGCCSMDELSQVLGVGTGCGRCRPPASEILNEPVSQPLPAQG